MADGLTFFLDEDRGWLARPGTQGNPGSIYRTTDGGASWERVFMTAGTAPMAVGFATPEIGWLGNLNFLTQPPEAPLYETLDGGESWHDVSARIEGPVAAGMNGIFVLDRDNIFAVGRFIGPAHFMRSNDGGATWKSSDLAPLANGLVDVHFFDRLNGVAVGGVGENRGVFQTVVLRTEDGGDSLSADTGWVASERVIYRTNDGGLSWSESTFGENVNRIRFLPSRRGYAAGQLVYRFNP